MTVRHPTTDEPSDVFADCTDSAGVAASSISGEASASARTDFQLTVRAPLTIEEAILEGPAHMRDTYSERIQEIVDFVASKVPPERRVSAPVSIAGPVLERLKYIEDESPLKVLYTTLLTRAADRLTQMDIHPGFIHVIEQLSRDEAVLMLCLKQKHVELKKRNGAYAPGRKSTSNAFYLPNIAPDVDPDEVPKGLVNHPKHMKMYLAHLLALNLIKIKPPPKIDHDTEWLTWTVYTSEFGSLFLSACVPTPVSAGPAPEAK